MDPKKLPLGLVLRDEKLAKTELQRAGEGGKERANCRLITFPTGKEKTLHTMQNLNSSLCR